MSKRLASGLVLGAIGFDSCTDAIVAATCGLARRLGLEARFIHVVDPGRLGALDLADPSALGPYPLPALPDVWEAERDALAGLRRLSAMLPPDLAVTTDVLVGPVVSTLLDEARARDTAVLVAGFDRDDYSPLTARLATAVALMQEASMPVLVVPSRASPDFGVKGLRLLVADDFRADGREAADVAAELGARCFGARIRRVHIHGDFRESLRRSLADVRAWVKGADDRRTEEGEMQSAPSRETPGHVPTELVVRMGTVAEELHHEIADFDPDIVVFGRHRLWRSEPYLLGRMSPLKMLHERRAVLLVPTPGRPSDPCLAPQVAEIVCTESSPRSGLLGG